MRLISFAAAAAVATLAALPASAGVITQTINFSLGGFADINSGVPVPPPVSNVSGSFTVTFDPALNYVDDVADITVHTFSGPTVDSVLGFTYDPISKFFWLGGLQNGADFDAIGTNDFVLTLDLTNISHPVLVPCNAPSIVCAAATGNGAFDASGYTSTSSGTALWFISATQSKVATPEPASIALLGFGLLGAGLASRRRRQRG